MKEFVYLFKTMKFFLAAICLIPFVAFNQQDVLFNSGISECETESQSGFISVLVGKDYDQSSEITTLEVKGYANCYGIHHVKATVQNDTVRISFRNGGIVYHDSVEVDTLYTSDIDNLDEVDTLIERREYSKTEREEVILALCNCCYTFRFHLTGLQEDGLYTYFLNHQELISPEENEQINSIDEKIRLNKYQIDDTLIIPWGNLEKYYPNGLDGGAEIRVYYKKGEIVLIELDEGFSFGSIKYSYHIENNAVVKIEEVESNFRFSTITGELDRSDLRFKFISENYIENWSVDPSLIKGITVHNGERNQSQKKSSLGEYYRGFHIAQFAIDELK